MGNSKVSILEIINFLYDIIFIIINTANFTYNDKVIALFITTINFLLSLFLIFFFDFSSNQFQFVIESININEYNFYLGVDGISIYFVLLTTIIMPIAILSN